MADTYVPGMEFKSWRSLPRVRDLIGSPLGVLLGGALDNLTGGTGGSDFLGAQKKPAGSVDPAEFVDNLSITKQPFVPPSYGPQGKFPSAYQTQEDLMKAPQTVDQSMGLPLLPSLNAQPIYGGYRKFLDMNSLQ
jgi:hypothetical protein